MEKFHPGRRRLLRALVLAAISLPLLGKFLIPKIERQKGVLRVKKKDIPGGGALVFKRKKVAVVKEGSEIHALSLVCTHLGCSVQVTSGGIVCPCHGSRFSHLGKVLRGPADRPLQRLAVQDRGDHIVVVTT